MKKYDSANKYNGAPPKPTRKLEINVIMRGSQIINWLQIIVSAALTVAYFVGNRSGTIVFFVLLIPVIVVGNMLFTQSLTKAIARAEQADSLRSVLEHEEMLNRQLRAQRHDFLNHLQVVYSLMQLGENEEAVTYLREVYSDLREVGTQLRTHDPAVNALLAAKAQQAGQRGIAMTFDIRTGLDRISMESWELCRVLGNLLDNAIDASAEAEKGWVRVSLWEDVAGLHFSVSNNGPGIPEDLKERIFAAGFTTKASRGTGMGLYIIRNIVEEAGGHITVDSRDGETHFVGWIPPVAATGVQRDI